MTLREAVATGLPYKRSIHEDWVKSGDYMLDVHNAIADDWEVQPKFKVKVWKWETVKGIFSSSERRIIQTNDLTENAPRGNWTKVPGSEREIEVVE